MAAKKDTKSRATEALEKTRQRASAVKKHGNTQVNQFVDFLRTQGVVGLAVGLAIGTAAGDTVKKLVQAFIDPVVQLIVGSQEGLQAASFTVEIADRKGEFMYGAFISSLITLVAVALVVYLLVHFLRLDRLDKKKDK